MSKRPLCLLVVFYTAFLFLLQIVTDEPRSYPGLTDKQEFAKSVTICLAGQLYKKETKNNHQIYYLKDIQIISDSNSINSNSTDSKEKSLKNEKIGAMCYMDAGTSVSEIPIGRRLLVRGEIMPFEQAENDGQFDAKGYYESLGIRVCLWNAQVQQQGRKYDYFTNILADIKRRVSETYYKRMKADNAGILCAMLLGDKTSLDGDVKTLYQKSGIAHVLAISGLHISLLGMLLYRLLRRCGIPSSLCSLLGIFGVLVYIKLAGASVSSVRAVSMFVLYMLADLFARTYDLLTALAFAALISLSEDPSVLFQAGFLLSYLSVLGLALLLPVLQERLSQGMTRKRLRQGRVLQNICEKFRGVFLFALLPGYAVQILIFPVILWFYYEFPLYSFLLNLIVVPCMSVVLVSGMLGALPGLSPVLYLAEIILDVYEWLCRVTLQLPGAVIVTGRPNWWQVLFYYFFIAVWYAWGKRHFGQCDGRDVMECQNERGAGTYKEKTVPAVRFRYLLIPLLCMCMFLLPVHRENRVDMLSVGQGDCICMRDVTGRVVLVDGGSTDVSEVGEYRLIPFLKYHGITQVDAVFVSHAHADHYSAVMELLENGDVQGVRVKTLCLPAVGNVAKSVGSSSEIYEQMSELAQSSGCKVVFIGRGDQIKCGQMQFDCVYPPPDITVTDENDASMVLLAQLEDFSMLFTGDSPSSCDKTVIRRVCGLGVKSIDCLKVAHHGAQTSTSSELLEAFGFELAVISCGEGNSYGHPHASLLNRLAGAGCHVFVTAKSGQITIRPGRKGRIRVSEYRKE